MAENTNIQQQLQTQMVAAMKAGEKQRAQVLRMLLSEVKAQQTDDPAADPDAAIQAYAKKLRKAMEEYQSLAQRPDAAGATRQADALAAELAIVQPFLPAAIDDAALQTLVQQAIAATGVTQRKQAGKVIGMVMKQAGGAADAARVRALIEQQLPE